MIISTNHQAKLNLEKADPYKWKLFPDFSLLAGIVFIGTIALLGSMS